MDVKYDVNLLIMRSLQVLLAFLISGSTVSSFAQEIPEVYTNIGVNRAGALYFENPETGERKASLESNPEHVLSGMENRIHGTAEGLGFRFDSTLQGTLYYGFIDHRNSDLPQPVFFKRNAAIKDGRAEIPVAEMTGKYDMTGWQATGRSRMGYRVVNDKGAFICDGKINIRGRGPFEPDLTITEGPFLSMQTPESITVSFKTNRPAITSITAGRRTFAEEEEKVRHVFLLDGLHPDRYYVYVIHYGDHQGSWSFRTAPEKGTRKPFTFAYASDSRSGQGGGERSIYGTNAYILKKIMALAKYRGAAFLQFTGDLIDGYSTSTGETRLQYRNWFRALEPFAAYLPVNIGMGNHEAVVRTFEGEGHGISIDRFPFDAESSEALFAEVVANPMNGPESEDGSVYDPDTKKTSFPSYKESVYHYTYGNMAMVVLNTNYWYAPSVDYIPYTGGNPHGYIMDNQLQWLRETLQAMEADEGIDHVFVTLHTPAFPNGGHVQDDMWYDGNNAVRPYIAGQPVKKGIIERRDEFLDILINENPKVAALLCGDEHNYSRLRIDRQTLMYPASWTGPRLEITRPFWQITNGSAGAPYYAREDVPWKEDVEIFSTQYALCLFHVSGEKVNLEVINPDTMEGIEMVEIR